MPNILPESLRLLADMLTWLLLGLFILVGLAATIAVGPFAKRLNKVAVEEDEKMRNKFRIKQPWDK